MLRGCGLPIVDEMMVILPLSATPAHKHAPRFEGKYLWGVVQKRRCCLQLRAALGCQTLLKNGIHLILSSQLRLKGLSTSGPVKNARNEGAAGQGALWAPFLSA